MVSNQIILHLGVHKTASSSIQRTLSHPGNQTALECAGITVPRSLASNCSGFFMSAFSEYPERYHANVREGLTAEEVAERVGIQMTRLQQEMRDVRRGIVVFSGEDGCTLSEAALCRLKAFLVSVVPSVDNISVVVYTREPVSYVNSAIQENVKGNARTIEQAKAIHLHRVENRYRQIHSRLAAVFGSRRVAFRSFEAATMRFGDVVRDFLNWIGVEPDWLTIKRINEAASSESIRLLSYLYARNIQVGESDKAILLSLPGTRSSLIERLEKEFIREASADDRAFLSQQFDIDYGSALPEEPAEEQIVNGHNEFIQQFLAVQDALAPDVRTAARYYLGIGPR
jgi:hypothetical protein